MIHRFHSMIRQAAIDKKMSLIIALTLIVFTLVTLPLLLALEVKTTHQYAGNHVQLLGELVGTHCSPYCKHKCSTQGNILSYLSGNKQIIMAELFDHEHNRTVNYQAQDYDPMHHPPLHDAFHPHFKMSRSHASIARPMFDDDNYFGFVRLVLDLQEFRRASKSRIILSTAAFFGGIMISLCLFLKLRAMVLAPLRDLASLMADVAASNDYSRRAQPVSNDEVGVMAESCNRLLKQIEENQEERDKLVDDLHDGAGGIMTNINLLAATALRQKQDETTRKLLTTIEELSGEGVTEIRRFIACVDRRSRDWHQLVSEMRRYGYNLLDTSGVGFNLDFRQDNHPPPPDSLFMLHLWRIYSESLNNILKHARAGKVRVFLQLVQSELIMKITDDGAGIAGDTIAARGTANMKKRAAAMGGHLTINDTPGGGTRVQLVVPLNR